MQFLESAAYLAQDGLLVFCTIQHATDLHSVLMLIIYQATAVNYGVKSARDPRTFTYGIECDGENVNIDHRRFARTSWYRDTLGPTSGGA